MFLTGKCIYSCSDYKIKSSLLHEGTNVKIQGTKFKIQATELTIHD